MSDDDFIRVEGKVPRRDKAGKEIETEDLGSGGARRSDGTLSAMAYDLRPLLDEDGDHVEVGTPQEPTIPPWMVEFLLYEVVLLAARASYPHLKRWLIETAAPGARGRWRELKARRKDTRATAEAGARSHALAEQHDERVEHREQANPAIAEPPIKLSSSEWQKGFLAWTEAAAVEEALRRMLTNATIEDDDAALLELQRALGVLSPAQRCALANRMLEAGSSTLDEDLLARLVKVFGDGRAIDGQYVPIELEQRRPRAAFGAG